MDAYPAHIPRKDEKAVNTPWDDKCCAGCKVDSYNPKPLDFSSLFVLIRIVFNRKK